MDQIQIEKAIVGILAESNIPLLAREICVLLNMKYPGNKFTKAQIKPIIWGRNLRKEVNFDSVSFKYYLSNYNNSSDVQLNFSVSTNKTELLIERNPNHIDFEKLKKIFEEEEIRISNPAIRLFIENVLFRLRKD
ncbi:hypothetical protein [Aquirufa antheringensis]|uniref:hypothetical protein n=1 Tax=Aquirufa antheringensis TaxID=2516559 RepID=UPI00208E8CBE|nr:hypothetical protein [Aquirufa antheringensis]USQ03153.1 hypothetical protein G9X63_03195 [Aquirufa antheringensis]